MRSLLAALCLAATLCASADTPAKLAALPAGRQLFRTGGAIDPDHFTFVVSGDNRSAGRNIPPPPTAEQILKEIRALNPALVLWTGDTIYGSDDSVGEAESEYDQFLGIAAAAGCPVYNAPGNH